MKSLHSPQSFPFARLSPAEVGQELGVEVDPVQHRQVLPFKHLHTFLVNKLIFKGTQILCPDSDLQYRRPSRTVLVVIPIFHLEDSG